MSGEKSKKSGEIGEALTIALLEKIGWYNSLHNLSIKCNTSSHKNDKGNPRISHGDDQVYLYNNPFHDDRTDIVHISVKNNIHTYPSQGTLRAKFKEYITELQQTIECAKYDEGIDAIEKAFKTRKKRKHVGLLVWLHNDDRNIDKDIITDLAPCRPEIHGDTPFYVIDNRRATFLFDTVTDLNSRSNGEYEFFYPKLGTVVSVDENRTGKKLPLEIIASDIIPAVVTNDSGKSLYLYANEEFNEDSYKSLIAYALSFSFGLIDRIEIGMPNYNQTKHLDIARRARLSFEHRDEQINAFSYKRSILSLLAEHG